MIAEAVQSAPHEESVRDNHHLSLLRGPSHADGDCCGPLVKHINSAKLTPQHLDVTDQFIEYAPPKKFVFLSRNQMRWINANRWFRQGAKDTKCISVEAITPEICSVDKRDVLVSSARAWPGWNFWL